MLGREPVMILAVIQSGIGLATAFGIDITPVQLAAVMSFSAAILGLVTRQLVTPNVQIPDNTILKK